MRTLLSSLLVIIPLNIAIAKGSNKSAEEFILPDSPPQKVYSRYQRDFSYRHDRGFYLSAILGPQWNQSVKDPVAKAIRFGGKIGMGFYVAEGVALFGSAWGNFLEQASVIAVGPGVAMLYDGPNLGLDISFGVGRAFNAFKEHKDFAETILAANLSFAKYFWLSKKTSLGISLNAGGYGFTLTNQRIGTLGFNAGLSLAFLYG